MKAVKIVIAIYGGRRHESHGSAGQKNKNRRPSDSSRGRHNPDSAADVP
jgi:hypothetical protein